MAWLLFSSAGFLADNVLHDHRQCTSLVFISPPSSLYHVCFPDISRANNGCGSTALSQVLNRQSRVSTVLLGAWWLLPRVWNSRQPGYFLGSNWGLAGLMVLLVIYFRYQPVPGMAPVFRSANEGSFSLLKRLVTLAFPIALGALVMPFVQTLDALIVPQRLQEAGYTMVVATEAVWAAFWNGWNLDQFNGGYYDRLGHQFSSNYFPARLCSSSGAVRRRLTIAIRVVGMVSMPPQSGFISCRSRSATCFTGCRKQSLPLKAMAPAVFFWAYIRLLRGSARFGKTIVPSGI